MTLILSVITPNFAIQASDRRVTTTRESRLITVDDERNKAVFVAERLTFAMTGAADIERDTIGFFAAQLSREFGQGKTVDVALQRVGSMCGQYLAQRADAASAFLALVGVGWTDSPPAPRSPLITWSSNAMDKHGRWRSPPAARFDTHSLGLRSGAAYRLLASGVDVGTPRLDRLRHDLRDATSESDQPAPVADILITHIRAVARANQLVGEGVMVNCLPYACGSPDGSIMLIGGPPKPNVRTFTYVPAGHDTGVYLGPHVVGGDGSQIAEFQAEGEPGSFGMTYGSALPEKQQRAAVGQRVKQSDIGRNDKCWCGSGRKFKKCHGR